MENKTTKIQIDPLTLIKSHKEKITKAFETINDFNDLEPAKQFLVLGHIKTLCVFCAEDMIRAQMLVVKE